MIFKIVFNNEIHRVRAEISTFEELLKAITARLPNLNKEAICCDYKDLDGDNVRINCQEDFAEMKTELEGKKSIKIFVKEDPNQTLQLPTQVSTDAVVVEPEVDTTVEVPEPVVKKQVEPVLMTLVMPEDRMPKPEPVQDEVSIEKPAPTEEEEETAEPEKTQEDFEKWVAWKKMWCKGGRGGRHGKHWEQKKRWWREKFNKKFDEAIQRALPQIAVHVAQILRNGGDSLPVEACAPMKESTTSANQSKVVHHGYICDGCGVSPIVGVCYKSSVCKDFDFCEKCEATIPHPHPFLKLKTPEQRPHAMIMVVNEEGKPPFEPKKHMPELMKNAKGLLGQMFCPNSQKDDNETPTFEEAWKNISKFVDPAQLKQFGVEPKMFAEMMSKKGNKCGQKNFCKMMKQGQKFMKKFMKQAHSGKGPSPVHPMMSMFMNQFKGKGGGCPFKGFKEAMKKKCQAKKTETPVEAMTFDEQLAHAMKLSMASDKTTETKTAEPTEPKVAMTESKDFVETPKTTTPTETPRNETTTSTPKSPSEMSFEQQLAAAMKLSLEESVKTSKLDDDVVIMNESDGTESVATEELYNSDEEEPKSPEVEPKKEEVQVKEPVVKVEEVDPVVLANTAQLMAICGVPENREIDVRKWVMAKAKAGNNGINELLNLFLDEMAGRF